MWTATQFAKLHQCSVLTTTWGCATTHHSIAFRAKQPRRCSPPRATAAPAVIQEDQVPGMVPFLDSLKYNKDGHVAVIVQVCLTDTLRVKGMCNIALSVS